MEVMAVSSLAIIVKGKVMLKKITGIKIRIQMFRVAPFAKIWAYKNRMLV